MKFAEILEKHFDNRNILIIEEYCGNRLVETHTSFGYGDENKLNLYGDAFGQPTEIDINQDCIIKNDLVTVKDNGGNKIDLRFFEGKSVDFK